ncbi:MAG: GNAT family N-acetyltransferase [Armatimonadota bacterium]
MHEVLDTVTLKSGETMDVLCVRAPDDQLADAILPLLHHKGEPWEWPMRRALAGDERFRDLAMRFYLGRIGHDLVGNITLIEKLERPVGILQHVWTPPPHRRKGICTVLMRACTEHFKRRQGRALYLGTGYQTPPYWIYHRFGFRGQGQTGLMRWFVEDDFEQAYFAPRQAHPRPVQWPDWALLQALFSVEHGWALRSIEFQIYGFSGFEGEFLLLQKGLDSGKMLAAHVLETDDGALVGLATLSKQPQWHFDTLLLDIFVNDNFVEHGGKLLRSLPDVDRKVQCYVGEEAPEKAHMLEAVGFQREATLKGQYVWEGEPREVWVYSVFR